MIQPHDLMTLAERLASTRQEPEGRAAVSRAYYSAFHTARLLVEQGCGVVLPKGPEAHKKLQLCLQESKQERLAEVGNRLESLREERNGADYKLADSKFSKPANVQLQLILAKEIIAELNAANNQILDFRANIQAYASGTLKLGIKNAN
jgi:hypothetical protein